MKENVTTLNFHQSFKPESQYLSAILGVSNTNNFLSLKEISDLTGIPNGISSGKVEPHIQYCKYMGLIDFVKKDGKYRLKRTSLGETIFIEDPGFQEKLSLLVCQIGITNPTFGAAIWSCSFNDIFPEYKSLITRDLFFKELEFYFGDKVSKKNVAPFLSSYCDIFYPLNLLEIDERNITIKKHVVSKDYIYVYAFALMNRWDTLYQKVDEISAIEFKKLHFDSAFNWDDLDTYKVLEMLSDKGLIRINRQLVPYTILRLTSQEKLLHLLFSELV